MGAVRRVYPEVDAGRLDRRFPQLDIGLCLLEHGRRVIVILPADRIVNKRFPVAFRLRSDRRQVGLGLAQGGHRILEHRLEGGGIDLVEHLAGRDFGAFRKQTPLDDPVHLGADFGDPVGGSATGQLHGQHDSLCSNGHGRDFRNEWRSGPPPIRVLAAPEQKTARQSDEGHHPFPSFQPPDVESHRNPPKSMDEAYPARKGLYGRDIPGKQSPEENVQNGVRIIRERMAFGRVDP